MFNLYYRTSFDATPQYSLICDSIARIGKPYLKRTYIHLLGVC